MEGYSLEELQKETFTFSTKDTNNRYNLNLEVEVSDENHRATFNTLCMCDLTRWAYVDRKTSELVVTELENLNSEEQWRGPLEHAEEVSCLVMPLNDS